MSKIENLVGEDYGKRMTLQEAMDKYPERDLIFVRDNPIDINCESITLYGVTVAGRSDDLVLDLMVSECYITRMSYECGRNPMGDIESTGFSGVQEWVD